MQMIERRVHKRFQASEGGVGATIFHCGGIGRIQNIGMGGFKCNCLGGKKSENLDNVCEFFQNRIRGERMAFSINILDSSYIKGHPASVIPEKQCRVQFIGLNDRQETFLSAFIKDHSFTES